MVLLRFGAVSLRFTAAGFLAGTFLRLGAAACFFAAAFFFLRLRLGAAVSPSSLSRSSASALNRLPVDASKWRRLLWTAAFLRLGATARFLAAAFFRFGAAARFFAAAFFRFGAAARFFLAAAFLRFGAAARFFAAAFFRFGAAARFLTATLLRLGAAPAFLAAAIFRFGVVAMRFSLHAFIHRKCNFGLCRTFDSSFALGHTWQGAGQTEADDMPFNSK